jgi:hypothetical protein
MSFPSSKINMPTHLHHFCVMCIMSHSSPNLATSILALLLLLLTTSSNLIICNTHIIVAAPRC